MRTNPLGDLGFTWGHLAWGLLFFVLGVAASLTLVVLVLIRLPASYYQERPSAPVVPAHPRSGWYPFVLVAKNLLGLVLVLIGLILSLPFVPGQGLLTILIGLLFLDLPGIRHLEIWLLRRPQVLTGINRLRKRFGQPPLVLDQDNGGIPEG